MADKKFIIKPGERVTIEINRKTKVQTSRSENLIRRGAIKHRRDQPYLARRLNQNYINFYDLGRYANAQEINEFVLQPGFPYLGGYEVGSPPIADLSDYEALHNFLSSVEGAGLEEKFYRITQSDGDYYRLKISADGFEEILTIDNDAWKTGGVRLAAGDLSRNNFEISIDAQFSAWRLNLFEGVKLSGEGKNKVTSEFDYNAEEVEGFTLRGGDSVFLYPRIVFYKGLTGMIANDDDISELTHYLFWDFRLGMRDYYVENFNPLFDPQDFIWGMNFFSSDPNYPQAYALMQDLIATLSGARAWQVGYDNNIEEYIFGSLSPANFLPNPPFAPEAPTFAYPTGFGMTGIPNAAPAGAPLAIVKRGSHFFYIWNTA